MKVRLGFRKRWREAPPHEKKLISARLDDESEDEEEEEEEEGEPAEKVRFPGMPPVKDQIAPTYVTPVPESKDSSEIDESKIKMPDWMKKL